MKKYMLFVFAMALLIACGYGQNIVIPIRSQPKPAPVLPAKTQPAAKKVEQKNTYSNKSSAKPSANSGGQRNNYPQDTATRAISVARKAADDVLQKDKTTTDRSYGSWVDLGLPSGTLWKYANETNPNDSYGFYTYDNAVQKYGNSLPSGTQFRELKDKCTWTWTGNGHRVTGPNGNSIFLPASGFRNCDGDVNYVGSRGLYWSSTPDGSGNARYLYFNSGRVNISDGVRCRGRSVRLVQD